MLQTVVFDMGNVLVHFSHERMCAQVAEVCGTSADEIQQLLMTSGLQWNFERGLISPEQLHARLQELMGRPVDFHSLRIAASDIFQLNAPIVPVLDQLRERGLRLVLLSNTSVWHYDFIREQFDVLERFDAMVLSFRVQAIKPEPRIFDAALAALECPPSAAFYTDDIPGYVEAARARGLHAEVFTEVPTLVRHLRDRGITLPL